MLLDGVNHVAIITDDTERFVKFYEEVFDATVSHREDIGPGTLTIVDIGPRTELNVFEVQGGAQPGLVRGSMFGNGPIDHIGLQAANRDAFVEIRRRLIARGAADGFVTDFGRAHSVFFRDPDGLAGEVLLWLSHDAPVHPPGTPATGYDAV
ncbi:MAG TPA: VOC family protein [Acidimicrobiia bacterium]|nr:VOC family protein [Acidimicrobiia bacterium]